MREKALRTISKKVCLLGDFAVGKTSLVRRFVYDRFDDKYVATIGVKVSRKSIMIPQDDDLIELTLMLWDLAGSEEFSRVRNSYLRGAAGALIVCDVTRRETLDSLRQYAMNLFDVSPDAQILIAANKRDLVDQQQLTAAELEALASDLGSPHYHTSAKTGEEVEDVFRQLGQLLVA
jgi:small GTP-binding protein